MKDHYLKATNAQAKKRKEKTIAENAVGSQWNKWPDEGIDLWSLKIDHVLIWDANLESKSFKAFWSKKLLGHNKPGDFLSEIPFWKHSLIHCARRVHTPEMATEAHLVKEFAPYRYDNFRVSAISWKAFSLQ